MTSEIDITAEDLKVFLQEAESLLDLLDEDIIRLEQEEDNEDLLQEIFRAAHTLKGSSGMIGFQEMAGLTHSMEDLLDRVRKGTVSVTAELIDALLMSHDGLKVLKNDLANGSKTTLQIGPIVAALNAVAEAGSGEDARGTKKTLSLDAMILSEPAIVAQVEEAENADVPLLRITVELDPASDWPAVRCFQVLNELDGKGEVLVSSPSQEDIEAEQVGHSLYALIATDIDGSDLSPILEAVEDVASASVEAWTGVSEEAASVPAPKKPDPAQAVGGAPDAKVDGLSQSVRIDVDVLDELMNLVGELVIDRTRVGQISKVLTQRHKEDEEVRALGETSSHIVKVIDELHESMMQVRMLPVGVLFAKFPRLVRDVSRTIDKNVSLVLEGEDTEIDRSVIEEIKDPLVHLIRNAVDHGVESPEDRKAAGKPETSILRLSARHAQGQIMITLTDDGKGIDPQQIRDSAVKKGALTVEAAERLSDQEAIELIFEPGLSTAAKTTEVSGRGVGMDIVRRNIEALNGRVEVETEIGVGSTFTLLLPLTLTSFGGLLVNAGATMYAIPLNYVQETVRPQPGDLKTVTGRPVMNMRGSVMSLIPLAETLAHQNGESTEKVIDPDNCLVVVVRAGDSDSDRPVAIAVDELVDQQEVVVKSLSGFLGRARGIAGASILGDGQVVLILDVPSLIKAAQQQGNPEAVEAERKTP